MNIRSRIRKALHPRGDNAGPIGFEIGSKQLKLVQFERGDGRVKLRASVTIPHGFDGDLLVERPKQLKALLERMLRDRGFRGRKIVSALPAEKLKLMVVNYKREASQAEAKTILGRVEERIGESPRGWVVDYLPIRTSGELHGEKSALVAVARESDVIEHLELLHAAGLVVDALEIVPVAVRRLVGWLSREDENPLVVHCDGKNTYLIALWGRRLILYREIEFGEDALVESLEKALGMDPEAARTALRDYGIATGQVPVGRVAHDPAQTLEISEAIREILKPAFNGLAEQIRKATTYTSSVARGASVDRLLLLGAPTRWPGAAALLEQLLALPVETLDTANLSPEGQHAPVEADTSADLAVAAGLALRGLWEDE